MDRIFCVRAEFGKFTEHFVRGGYIAVGGFSERDLSGISNRDELEDIHSSVSPDARNLLIGQQLDQIARFLFELKAGDFVITPSLNTEQIYFGVVQPEPNYYYDEVSDNCPFIHRKRVIWCASPLPAASFSDQFRNAMHSSLSVFPINQIQNFLATIENTPFETAPEQN
jgi:predicted Mrr-cat superfamily restriction endonuclease